MAKATALARHWRGPCCIRTAVGRFEGGSLLEPEDLLAPEHGGKRGESDYDPKTPSTSGHIIASLLLVPERVTRLGGIPCHAYTSCGRSHPDFHWPRLLFPVDPKAPTRPGIPRVTPAAGTAIFVQSVNTKENGWQYDFLWGEFFSTQTGWGTIGVFYELL
jgi:hypothetical protein